METITLSYDPETNESNLAVNRVPSLADALNMLITGIYQLSKSFLKETANIEARRELYTALNSSFGNVLDLIAPDGHELYPDYTAEAIMFVEDIFMLRKLLDLSDEDYAANRQKVQDFLAEKQLELLAQLEERNAKCTD